MRVNKIQPNLAFRAKDVTLYTDFDGTFLQSSAVNNDYFQAFDDFRRERENKFKLFITTGRRIEGDSGGFIGTYDTLRAGGYRFPRFDGIITSEGGDMFLFNSAGDVDRTPVAQKRALMKVKTGWDFDFVMGGLNDIAQRLKTTFTPVDKRSFHRISFLVGDSSKMFEFADMTEEFFEKNGIAAAADIGDIRVRNSAGVVEKQEGIKLSALLNGHHIHKDFDIFAALEVAQRENDFVIVAGNERNDKEMLNLFNYIGKREIDSVKRIPKSGLEEMVAQINKLPIGVIFVDSATPSPRMEKLKEFMEAQQKLFPNKVRIVKETKSGEENTLVKAMRELVTLHFPKEEKPSVPSTTPNTSSSPTKTSGKGKYIALGAIALGALATGVFYYKNQQCTKKD